MEGELSRMRARTRTREGLVGGVGLHPLHPLGFSARNGWGKRRVTPCTLTLHPPLHPLNGWAGGARW